MSDPISIIAGVAGILSTCITVSAAVKEFHDAAAIADVKVKSLLGDVESFTNVLQMMKDTLDQEEIKSSLQSTGHIGVHWTNLKTAIDDGENTLQQLLGVLKKVGKSASVLDGTRKHMRLKGASEEIAMYQRQIRSCRDALQLSLQTVILWNQVTFRESTDQIIPNLEGLHKEIRRIAFELNNRMAMLQTTMDSSADESQMRALGNLRNCVQSAASVLSSASTSLGIQPGDQLSTTYGSDFGDCFPSVPGETMLRWMSSITVYEYEAEQGVQLVDQNPLPALRTSIPTISQEIESDKSESDSDIEVEIVHALLKRGKENLAEGNFRRAERLFRNCMARTVSALSGHRSQRKLDRKAELTALLFEAFRGQQKWDDAQSILLERIAEGPRERDNHMVLVDTLSLVEVLLEKKAYAEALLYGRRALEGYRKLGSAGIDGKKRALQLLITASHADGNQDEEDAYVAILSVSTEEQPPRKARDEPVFLTTLDGVGQAEQVSDADIDGSFVDENANENSKEEQEEEHESVGKVEDEVNTEEEVAEVQEKALAPRPELPLVRSEPQERILIIDETTEDSRDELQPRTVNFIVATQGTEQDRLSVSYHELPISIISRSVLLRWGILHRVYDIASEAPKAGEGSTAVDLDWKLLGELHTTTFVVVETTGTSSDVVFGQNAFRGVLQPDRPRSAVPATPDFVQPFVPSPPSGRPKSAPLVAALEKPEEYDPFNYSVGVSDAPVRKSTVSWTPTLISSVPKTTSVNSPEEQITLLPPGSTPVPRRLSVIGSHYFYPLPKEADYPCQDTTENSSDDMPNTASTSTTENPFDPVVSRIFFEARREMPLVEKEELIDVRPPSARAQNATIHAPPTPRLSRGWFGTGSKKEEPYRRKIVVVGDSAHGKTCLVWRVLKGIFEEFTPPTVIDNYVAELDVDGKSVQLELWDMTGSHDYVRVRSLYYPGAHAILICFSIDWPDSLTNVEDMWLPEVLHFCAGLPIILVGLKKDLRHSAEQIGSAKKTRQALVSPKEAQEAARRIGAVSYLECSALTGEGANEVFEHALRAAMTVKPSKRGLRRLFA